MTLAADLDHQSSTHRARRIELVLTALRASREERRVHGAVPPPLDLAIRDFAAELKQLQAIRGPGSAVPVP